jgi:hypothetical protein
VGWIRRAWNGDIPLPRIFWLYGAIGFVAINSVRYFAFDRLVMGGFIRLAFPRLLWSFAVSAYWTLISIAVWRSAGHYTGAKIWAILARAMACLLLLVVALGVVATGEYLLTPDRRDASRNSENASRSLKRDPNYPLTGFWKVSCSDNLGLLIEPSKKSGKYSVSFCGPGGSFKPGTYRPDTTILNDPMYRVLNNDTIECKGQDGFSKYMRCE